MNAFPLYQLFPAVQKQGLHLKIWIADACGIFLKFMKKYSLVWWPSILLQHSDVRIKNKQNELMNRTGKWPVFV